MHKKDATHSCESALLGLDIRMLPLREHYTATASFVFDKAFLFQSFLDLFYYKHKMPSRRILVFQSFKKFWIAVFSL